MRTSVATALKASEGNKLERSFQTEHGVESSGNSLALTCLNEAVDAFVGTTQIPRKVLAEECGQNEAQFSKSLSGARGGDFMGVIDKIRPEIRLDWLDRMTKAQQPGGLAELAAEQLIHAAVRFLVASNRWPAKFTAAKAGLK